MNSRTRLPRSGTRGYAHLTEIAVPVSRVWSALPAAAVVRAWSGQDAELAARKGGSYRIGSRQAGGREAHIDIFDVDRRLRLIYLCGPDEPPSGSAVVDDFLLDIRMGDGTTSLRVLGSGIPEAAAWDKHYVRMRVMWERFLSNIKVVLEAPPPPKKPPAAPKDPPLAGLDY